MSLELAIQELNTNVLALTAALKAGGTAAASTGATTAETKPADAKAAAAKAKADAAAAKAAAKAAAPKYTREQMQGLLQQVKAEIGGPDAKKIIADAGFDKMADISEDRFEQVVDACNKALNPDTDGAGTDGDDL